MPLQGEDEYGHVTPVQLAKFLQVPPQKIYSLIKSGRVQNYAAEGATARVDEDEVKSALAGVGVRSKKSGPSGSKPQRPAKTGGVVAWKASPSKIAVGRITTADELMTTVSMADGTSEPALFKTESLAARIRKGQIVLPNTEWLIKLMEADYRARNPKSLGQADAMEYLMQEVRRVCGPKTTSMPSMPADD
jgi:hypothetical protein